MVASIIPRNSVLFDHLLSIYEGGVITETTSTNPVNFDLTAISTVRCVIANEGYTGYEAGVEEWSMAVEVSDTLNGTFVVIKSEVIPGSPNHYQFGLSGETIYKIKPDARFVRITASLKKKPDGDTPASAIGPLTLGDVYLSN